MSATLLCDEDRYFICGMQILEGKKIGSSVLCLELGNKIIRTFSFGEIASFLAMTTLKGRIPFKSILEICDL